MECKIKTDIGTIYINEDVMLKVVGYAALECYGIVAMSSRRAKDGLVEWLGRENLSKGVQIRSFSSLSNMASPLRRSAKPLWKPSATSWRA